MDNLNRDNKRVYVFNNLNIVNQLLPKHRLLFARADYKNPNSTVYIFGPDAKEDFDEIMQMLQQ